jgi:hypothetical protein
MNIFKIGLYAVLLVFLCSLTFSLATDYQKNETRSRCAFMIWVIDTLDLFIHETGHLVFKLFGRFMGFLGGSLFQILIPLAAVIVFAKSFLQSLPFTLYWMGQSMVNVSIYIGDAPYRRLQLISRSAIHDWNWLLHYSGTMNYAEDFALGVNLLGLIICIGGIVIGFYFTARQCIHYWSLPK